VILAGFCNTSVQARDAKATQDYFQNSSQDSLHDLDPEMLFLIKTELEAARKVLIEIRDTQNPAIIKKAVGSLGAIIKELTYIAGAVALGGGSTLLGITLIMGEGAVNRLMESDGGRGAILVVLPVIVGSIIVTYAFLKLVFGRLLSSSDKNAANLNIKDALSQIDQTINKLDYEIKKIDRLYQSLKTSI